MKNVSKSSENNRSSFLLFDSNLFSTALVCLNDKELLKPILSQNLNEVFSLKRNNRFFEDCKDLINIMKNNQAFYYYLVLSGY